MNIGVFAATLRTPKEKPEPKPIVAPPPVREAPPEQPKIGAYQDVAGDRMQIAVIARNTKLAQEFLCAVKDNMTKVQSEGLVLFSTENSTISDITAAKNRLDRGFFNRVVQWRYPADAQTGKNYVFRMSPSAKETTRIELVFQCGTPGALNISGAAAIWVLLDGHATEQNPDAYEQAVCDLLRNTDGKPVYLLMAHVESLSCFREVLGRFNYPVTAYQKLLDISTGLMGDLKQKATVLPVQIYGGMEYAGMDEDGQPVLMLNTSGSYKCVGCELPLLYTVAQLCQLRNKNYFESSISGGYLLAYRRYIQKLYEGKVCQPEQIGGDGV